MNKGPSKARRIAQGWSAYLAGRTTAQSRSRAAICKTCPHASIGSYAQWLPDGALQTIEGLRCDPCGCPLSTKLRVETETCPTHRW